MRTASVSSAESVGFFVQFLTWKNWLIMYGMLLLPIIYMIFGLTNTLPDTVLSWVGAGIKPLGETQALSDMQGRMEKHGMGRIAKNELDKYRPQKPTPLNSDGRGGPGAGSDQKDRMLDSGEVLGNTPDHAPANSGGASGAAPTSQTASTAGGAGTGAASGAGAGSGAAATGAASGAAAGGAAGAGAGAAAGGAAGGAAAGPAGLAVAGAGAAASKAQAAPKSDLAPLHDSAPVASPNYQDSLPNQAPQTPPPTDAPMDLPEPQDHRAVAKNEEGKADLYADDESGPDKGSKPMAA